MFRLRIQHHRRFLRGAAFCAAALVSTAASCRSPDPVRGPGEFRVPDGWVHPAEGRIIAEIAVRGAGAPAGERREALEALELRAGEPLRTEAYLDSQRRLRERSPEAWQILVEENDDGTVRLELLFLR